MQWVGAVSQQAIIWANIDPDLCCQMALLGLATYRGIWDQD